MVRIRFRADSQKSVRIKADEIVADATTLTIKTAYKNRTAVSIYLMNDIESVHYRPRKIEKSSAILANLGVSAHEPN
jgi:hypothetical protein